MQHQVVNGIAAGIGAIALGVTPGISNRLADTLYGLRKLLLDWQGIPNQRPTSEPIQPPVWLAGFGVVLIALAIATRIVP